VSGETDDADRALEHFPELRRPSGARPATCRAVSSRCLNLSMRSSPAHGSCCSTSSLSGSPVVVERLLTVVRELASGGTTMLLVEQSVPLASSPQRAYFLEQGQVRFSGRP